MSGKTKLISVDKNLNTIAYRHNILLSSVVLFAEEMGENSLFMHDNARLQTSRMIRKFLADNRIPKDLI